MCAAYDLEQPIVRHLEDETKFEMIELSASHITDKEIDNIVNDIMENVSGFDLSARVTALLSPACPDEQ
jgi:hypothetical protein